MTPKFRQIVPIGAVNLLDKAMEAEAFEESGRPCSGLARKMLTQMFILETPNVELAASDGFKQGLVFLIKEVESGVAALIVDNCPGDFVQVFNPGAAIIQSGDEL